MRGSGDYISREAANEACRESVRRYPNSFYNGIEAARDAICHLPAADVRPVRRGKWVGYPECLKYPNAYSDDHIVCSACEECFSILDNDCERFNFCPNCGADMREES